MASTNFYYSPTTGTGNTQITVSAASSNETIAQKSATITFTNGVSSCTVGVVQKYRPSFTEGPTSVPATGGSVSGFIYSQYDIAFQNVPSWITITINGSAITANQRVGASAFTTTPTTVLYTAAPNTGMARSASTVGFRVGYIMREEFQSSDTHTITVNQAAAEGISTDVNEVVFDWNATSAQTFNVVTFESWTSSINDD